MKFVLLSLYNKVNGYYAPLQSVRDQTDDDLIETNRRSFLEAGVKREVAEALDLYKMGTFEDSTGEISILDKPQYICSLIDFYPMKEVSTDENRDTKSA